MPGLLATFADLRLAGVSWFQWNAHHRSMAADFPKVKTTTYEEWCEKVHVPLTARFM